MDDQQVGQVVVTDIHLDVDTGQLSLVLTCHGQTVLGSTTKSGLGSRNGSNVNLDLVQVCFTSKASSKQDKNHTYRLEEDVSV